MPELSGAPLWPYRSPKHLGHFPLPIPPPSPTLPTASSALPDVSQLLQHLWAAAAGAGGSSRAGEQLLVSCPPCESPTPTSAALATPAQTHPGHSVTRGERKRLGQRGTTHSTQGTSLEVQRVPPKKVQASFYQRALRGITPRTGSSRGISEQAQHTVSPLRFSISINFQRQQIA